LAVRGNQVEALGHAVKQLTDLDFDFTGPLGFFWGDRRDLLAYQVPLGFFVLDLLGEGFDDLRVLEIGVTKPLGQGVDLLIQMPQSVVEVLGLVPG